MKDEQMIADAAHEAALADRERAMETVAGWAAIRPRREEMAMQALIHRQGLGDAKHYLNTGQVWSTLREVFEAVDGVIKYSREHPPK
jgi:hypothetical protein